MRSLLRAATVAGLVALFAIPAFAYDAYWATTFAGVGFNGPVNVVTEWNGDLVVGGGFVDQGGIHAADVARWDGTSWHAMGDPDWFDTHALADFNGTLYGSGLFGAAYNPILLEAWDPGTETWSAVATLSGTFIRTMTAYGARLMIAGDIGGSGPDGSVGGLFYYDGADLRSVGNGPDFSFGGRVMDMVEIGGILYATGTFDILADSTTARSLAAWDGTTWSPVFGKSSPTGPLDEGIWASSYGSQYGADGYALAVYQGKLVVAGYFDHAGDFPVSNVVAWDPATQLWDDLGGGGGDVPTSAAVSGSNLYLGSALEPFTSFGGATANHLVRYDGATWSDVGGGTAGVVNDLFVHNGDLVAGGDFHSAGGVQCEHIAWWDGASFTSHDAPGGQGLDDRVNALAVHDGKLVAAGRFDYGGTTFLGRIGAWDGSGWNDLAGGANGNVTELTEDGTDLAVAGDFTEIGGVPAAYVARWNGASWQPYGAGLPAPASAMTVHGGEVVVGGGSIATVYLKRWDGLAWQDVPIPGTVISVQSLGSFNGELIAGASVFSFSGQSTYVGRWNGVDWNPLLSASGFTVDDQVFVLKEHDGAMYMGGSFSCVEDVYPNGCTEAHTAVWDGTTLTRLQPVTVDNSSSGNFTTCLAIGFYDGNTFLGGDFAPYLWSNDGVQSSWQTLPVGSTVYAMEAYGGRLFVAGDFPDAGGVTSSRIAALSADVTAVGPPGAATATVLEQNHPNPFNPITTIHYRVAERGRVTLRIYSVSGAVVRTLVDAVRDPGVEHTVSWDGTDDAGRAVASGLYFCRLTTNGTARTRKMVLLK